MVRYLLSIVFWIKCDNIYTGIIDSSHIISIPKTFQILLRSNDAGKKYIFL